MLAKPICRSLLLSICAKAATRERQRSGYKNGTIPSSTSIRQNATSNSCHIKKLIAAERSEEHTSELQSLMRTSYAVLRMNKKIKTTINNKIVTNKEIIQ